MMENGITSLDKQTAVVVMVPDEVERLGAGDTVWLNLPISYIIIPVTAAGGLFQIYNLCVDLINSSGSSLHT